MILISAVYCSDSGENRSGRANAGRRLIVDELCYAVNMFTNISRSCLDRFFREIVAAEPF